MKRIWEFAFGILQGLATEGLLKIFGAAGVSAALAAIWAWAEGRSPLDIVLITVFAIACVVWLLVGVLELTYQRRRRIDDAGPSRTELDGLGRLLAQPELDRLLRNIAWLAETLTSHQPYAPQEAEATKRYRQLLDSDHIIWAEPKLRQLRRDFLNRCGRAMAYAKRYDDRSERDEETADIRRFADEIRSKFVAHAPSLGPAPRY